MCEIPSFISERISTANRQHKCCECRGNIFKGEKYHRFCGVWNGQFDRFKVCRDCQLLREKIQDSCCEYDLVAFTELGIYVIESKSLEHIVEYVEIKKKRNAPSINYYEEKNEELKQKCAARTATET